jgi:bifunctional non-homologous end joining protein LigD
LSPEPKTTDTEVDGRRLRLSNLDKVLYPELGFTKAEVISYYVHIAPVLLGHLARRPATFVRFPDGVDGPSFFEKNLPRGAPGWIETVRVPRSARGDGADLEQVVVADLSTLIWAANLASLEIHVPMWRSSRNGEFGGCDEMVFDLDPGAPADIVSCCTVAALLREELTARNLVAYPKTSGSKGLQLYVPIDPPCPASVTHDLAHRIAQVLERRHPELIVSRMRKALRTGKVLIDWSQNHPAKTTIAPYSLRARSRPTVSTPVSWTEVEECRTTGNPDRLTFTAPAVLERVDAAGDLFVPLLGPG